MQSAGSDGAPAQRPGLQLVEGIGAPDLRSLWLPNLKATDLKMMATHLLYATSRWNYEVSDGVCCRFHARVAIILKISLDLADLACGYEDFGEEYSKQCQRCGLLVDSSEISHVVHGCDFCKSE